MQHFPLPYSGASGDNRRQRRCPEPCGYDFAQFQQRVEVYLALNPDHNLNPNANPNQDHLGNFSEFSVTRGLCALPTILSKLDQVVYTNVLAAQCNWTGPAPPELPYTPLQGTHSYIGPSGSMRPACHHY